MSSKRQNITTGQKLALMAVILCAFIGSLLYISHIRINSLQEYKQQLEHIHDRYVAVTLARQDELQTEKQRLQTEKNELIEGLDQTHRDLEAERERNERLESRVAEITDTLDVVQRFQDTDPELLKKYSRVYFLSDNYEPEELTEVPEYFSARADDETIKFHARAWTYLEDMVDAAELDGCDLRMISGYRSFDEQADLKQYYTTTFGRGTANEFSADQGYSEHQLGTAMDFSTEDLGHNFTNFGDTYCYEWLHNNAHNYGFVISYPQDNPFFQYEPWHWRFVGVELATELYEQDMYFFEMDQREIDTYRADLFY